MKREKKGKKEKRGESKVGHICHVNATSTLNS